MLDIKFVKCKSVSIHFEPSLAKHVSASIHMSGVWPDTEWEDALCHEISEKHTIDGLPGSRTNYLVLWSIP